MAQFLHITNHLIPMIHLTWLWKKKIQKSIFKQDFQRSMFNLLYYFEKDFSVMTLFGIFNFIVATLSTMQARYSDRYILRS